MTANCFHSRFLRLIALTWLLPPMLGFSFLLYIEVFSFVQLISMMSTWLKPLFLVGGFVLALTYFHYFSKPFVAYLNSPDTAQQAQCERAMNKFPLHFWCLFVGYLSLAPAAAIISLESVSSYVAQPVDWFRVHLVALIVSIIVGLPIFISIYDLFGKAFGHIHLHKPIVTIKTKVFLIGAFIPLLIDTMLVQYFWTRTGFFNTETFLIWLVLEVLAVAGALLFVKSFNQALAPLESVIESTLNARDRKIKSASTDELGMFANQLSVLLDEQQLHKERLEFSNELLKASHSSTSLSKLLETVVNRTCLALQGDICFLSLYEPITERLVCVAHSEAGYKEEGHFEIALDETAIQIEVFKNSEPRVVDNVETDSNTHVLLKNTYNLKSLAAVPLISDTKTIGVLQISNSTKMHHYNKHELKILQVFAQEAAIIQTFFEGLKHRRKAETAITQIMRAVSTAIGEEFFDAMTWHMENILQADACGIVVKIEGEPDIVETVSYYYDGEIKNNIRYDITGTPCETIIGKETKTYTSDIQKQFPDDVHLCDCNMESYVGIPLFDSSDRPLGLLFAMFRRPIEDIDFNESVMRIFAARTSAEIERTQTESRIKHMAYYDGLTQLPNREYLLDRLQQAIAHAQRQSGRLAVMMLDLDHFKKINDSLGHPVGDGLLKEVASRLRKCIRKEDTVARLGGDEFVILLGDFDTRESTVNHVGQIAALINQTLKQHYQVSGHNLMMTSSCGIAIYPDDGDSAEQLIKHADTALYKAKEKGRDNFKFFSSEMNAVAMERLEMESAIHLGMEENQFEVVYQPKVRVADNRIIGAEILLRWNHPELGSISPERFIPIADETGQIIQLGEYIFEQACKTTSEQWCKTDCCNELYSLSVNVSPRQFQNDNFVKNIAKILNKYNINPRCIELEVTENILIVDAHKATEKLQALRDMGFKISIDDFGTGYASFRYLQQLPIEMIKIDRSFITNVVENKNDLSIVKTMMMMAENLDIKVIAEGVETQAQLDVLKGLGCEFYQGFLFSEPVKNEVFSRMLKEQRDNV